MLVIIQYSVDHYIPPFSLPTHPYRISLRFSSEDLSFPCSHSMRSQGHSNSYIKNGAMTQAQGNLHIFPEVVSDLNSAISGHFKTFANATSNYVFPLR